MAKLSVVLSVLWLLRKKEKQGKGKRWRRREGKRETLGVATGLRYKPTSGRNVVVETVAQLMDPKVMEEGAVVEAEEAVDHLHKGTSSRAMHAMCENQKRFSEDPQLRLTEAEKKIVDGEKLRKKLHNTVLDLKGNIRVFCRIRPLISNESLAFYFDGANDGDIGIMNGGTTKKTFKFDRVYTPKDGTTEVYADASPLVTLVLDGYNVCIFAYRQTGTGKTFAMEGTERNREVNYRTLEELFKIAEERKDTVTYNISVSVLEVYNEQIRDLLATSPSCQKLEIKQAGEGSHHVPGIVEAKVEDINEVWDVLQTGSNSRATGSNNVNEHSSRSHCILCIMVRAKNLINGVCTTSKLWLVDLVGSEQLAKTYAQGDRLKEAQNINMSLSSLGDVIYALASRSSHIPYRNSKLTHLLQDSLGDSKVVMFVQISPSDNDASETLSLLNFASHVRGIELGPAKKQVDTAELQKVKQMLERSKQEAKLNEESLRKLEEKCQNLENKAKGKEQLYKNLEDKDSRVHDGCGKDGCAPYEGAYMELG
ncbi:kinesin-like protein KIN-14E [Triticum dicoccoides]|uniref:kinesin-like protein KIN-14E n=1 Tax=Triticum dicoccoides TaxID=85692 RepID=UPI0018905A70|nr:kinesin-like protein KIN-14E [Triticum dicoccoides]